MFVILLLEPYGFVYITTNLINGKKYIGQKKYINGWKEYLGSGVHLKNAIKKYGKENFSKDIIQIGYSKEELNELEVKLIKKYNSVESDEYYNISEGGLSGNVYAGKSKEEMKKISETKRNKSHFLGLNGDKHPRSKSVFCETTNEVFGSILEAQRKYGIANESICACCRNQRKSAGKHPITKEKLIWVYY